MTLSVLGNCGEERPQVKHTVTNRPMVISVGLATAKFTSLATASDSINKQASPNESDTRRPICRGAVISSGNQGNRATMILQAWTPGEIT